MTHSTDVKTSPTHPATTARPAKASPLARPLVLAYWLALAVGTHWPGLDLGYSLDVVFQLDKILHALAMGALMLGLAWARPLGSRAAWPAQALAACLIASAYAVLDELSQGWMDRIVSPADAVA
ncbi:MAG TPA: VanZ family protein, partial [Phycisphaeraceae bacterium]